jgi:hypothetical protein
MLLIAARPLAGEPSYLNKHQEQHRTNKSYRNGS